MSRCRGKYSNRCMPLVFCVRRVLAMNTYAPAYCDASVCLESTTILTCMCAYLASGLPTYPHKELKMTVPRCGNAAGYDFLK